MYEASSPAASRRRRQALATRADVVAAAPNVSVETIYQQFGGKPGLVRAIVDQELAEAEPVPAYERSDQMRQRESDPRRIIRNWGAFVTELAPRGAPIVLLMRTAATSDPELARVYEDIARERLYELLVLQRGWSVERYGKYVAEALIAALLPALPSE